MTLPQDPVMLMSMVNMKLRDGGYSSLTDLCKSLDIDETALKEKLASAGFEFLPSANQFR